MYISMNWIGDFVDLSGLDLESLIHRFTLSTAEVEDIFHKGEDPHLRGPERHYAQVRRPPAGGVPRPVLPQ